MTETLVNDGERVFGVKYDLIWDSLKNNTDEESAGVAKELV